MSCRVIIDFLFQDKHDKNRFFEEMNKITIYKKYRLVKEEQI
jgi:hypothetical protein